MLIRSILRWKTALALKRSCNFSRAKIERINTVARHVLLHSLVPHPLRDRPIRTGSGVLVPTGSADMGRETVYTLHSYIWGLWDQSTSDRHANPGMHLGRIPSRQINYRVRSKGCSVLEKKKNIYILIIQLRMSNIVTITPKQRHNQAKSFEIIKCHYCTGGE